MISQYGVDFDKLEISSKDKNRTKFGFSSDEIVVRT